MIHLQLNFYGFNKFSRDASTSEFKHSHFRKGRKDLLALIKRKKSVAKSAGLLVCCLVKKIVKRQDGFDENFQSVQIMQDDIKQNESLQLASDGNLRLHNGAAVLMQASSLMNNGNIVLPGYSNGATNTILADPLLIQPTTEENLSFENVCFFCG